MSTLYGMWLVNLSVAQMWSGYNALKTNSSCGEQIKSGDDFFYCKEDAIHSAV